MRITFDAALRLGPGDAAGCRPELLAMIADRGGRPGSIVTSADRRAKP